jgi:hypothetical protein
MQQHSSAGPAISQEPLIEHGSSGPPSVSQERRQLAAEARAAAAAGTTWPSSSGSTHHKDSRLLQVLQSQLDLQRRLQETMTEQGRLRVRAAAAACE